MIAALLAGGLLLAGAASAPPQQVSRVAPACAAPIASTGVLIDWDRLAAAVAPRVRSLGPPSEKTLVMAGSARVIAQRSWSWHKGSRALQLQVLRLPDRAAARAQLDEIAGRAAGRPYGAGPSGLGDASRGETRVRGRERVLWTYQDLMFDLASFAAKVDAVAVARLVQQFAAQATELHGSERPPSLDVSPKRLATGAPLRIELRLPADCPREMFETEIVELTGPTHDQPPHLDFVTNDRFVATATAVRPGTAHVEARVVHGKTIALLVLPATIEVLAAPAGGGRQP